MNVIFKKHNALNKIMKNMTQPLIISKELIYIFFDEKSTQILLQSFEINVQ